MMNATNIRTEIFPITGAILIIKLGSFAFKIIPISRGTPRVTKTSKYIAVVSKDIELTKLLVGAYRDDQNKIFKGIVRGPKKDESDVMLTEYSRSPSAKSVRRFDMFPPGQLATTNKPNAIAAGRLNKSTSSNVNAGSKTSCPSKPINIGLGALNESFKFLNI